MISIPIALFIVLTLVLVVLTASRINNIENVVGLLTMFLIYDVVMFINATLSYELFKWLQ